MFKQMFQQELRKTYKFMPKKRNDIEGHFATKKFARQLSKTIPLN